MSAETYTINSNDWVLFSKNTKITLYNDFEADQPTTSYSTPRQRTFDEVMEEVLEDRTEAWEKLADL